MVYHYNKVLPCNLDYIHEQVYLSLMLDKAIDYCRWDEDESDLEVYWNSELTIEDKDILDQIVAQS
jgi:hypothetical protein